MNWGTKISLIIIVFIFFIVSMAVFMFRANEKDALIENNYYEKGINYDQDYNAINNVYTSKVEPILNITSNQLIIQLKDSVNYQLKLKCIAESKDDIAINSTTIGSDNLILVNKQKMRKGTWALELRWDYKQKEYLYKKELVL